MGLDETQPWVPTTGQCPTSLYSASFTRREELHLGIFDWIQRYKRKRQHWGNRLQIADPVQTSC